MSRERKGKVPNLSPPSSWTKTPRARIAHLYTVCENCGGKGWLIDGPSAEEAFRGGYERGVSAGKLVGNDAFADLAHHWEQWQHESGNLGSLGGLAIDVEPCLKCGGWEGGYWPARGRGYVVACGRYSYSSEKVVEAPDAERCRRCLEAVAQRSEYPNLARALASGLEFEPVPPRIPRSDDGI